jgi:hypothetical protein
MYQRSKKRQIDNYEIKNLKNITVNKPLLKRCGDIKEEGLLTGDTRADKLYKDLKYKLNCVNVHNLGNILIGEFKTTNFLVYDIDNLSSDETKRLFYFSRDICQATMLSPSRRGVKLFFEFHENTINERNLKLLYENFGSRMMKYINENLKTNIDLDVSSNDLNRLCFIGNFVINENMLDCKNDPNLYYTKEELDSRNKSFNKVINGTNGIGTITNETTLERLENTIEALNIRGVSLVNCYNDLMNFGFMFASLSKSESDTDVTEQQSYDYYKQVVNPGPINSDSWSSKSGSGNVYDLGYQFNTFLDDWEEGSTKMTIGSFFHICKEKYNITGLKIFLE